MAGTRKFKDLMANINLDMTPKSRATEIINLINKYQLKDAQDKADSRAGYRKKSNKPSSSTKCIRNQVLYFLGFPEQEDAQKPTSIRIRRLGEDIHLAIQEVLEGIGLTWDPDNEHHRTEIKFKDEKYNISGKFDNEIFLDGEDITVELKSIGERKFKKLIGPPPQPDDVFDISLFEDGKGKHTDWFKYWVQAQIYMWQRKKKVAVFLYICRDDGDIKGYDIKYHQPTIDWYIDKILITRTFVEAKMLPPLDHELVEPLCSKWCRYKDVCSKFKDVSVIPEDLLPAFEPKVEVKVVEEVDVNEEEEVDEDS